MKSYTHFTLDERICLAGLIKLGLSQTKIACLLGRNRSTISREIKRNSNKDGKYPTWAPSNATRTATVPAKGETLSKI